MSARRATGSRRTASAHSLQIALYTLTPFYPIAILLFLWLARVLRRDGHSAAKVSHDAASPPDRHRLPVARAAGIGAVVRPRPGRRCARRRGARARPTATSACSRAFPTRCRRSDGLRWRPPVAAAEMGGRAHRDRVRPGLRPAAEQDAATSIRGAPMPVSEDCLTLNIWAPANAKNAPVFVWIHGGALVDRVEPRADLRRQAAGRARRDRRVDQLSARRARLARASRAERGIAAARFGQLRPARPDRGAALGARQYRRVRRRSRQRDDRRRIGGRAQRDVSARHRRWRAGCSRKAIVAERLHDLDARPQEERVRRAVGRGGWASCVAGGAAGARHRRRCAGWTRRRSPTARPSWASRRSAVSTAWCCPQQMVDGVRPGKAGAGAAARRVQPGRDPLADDARAQAAGERGRLREGDPRPLRRSRRRLPAALSGGRL